jgi:hypothetical protein
VNGTPIVDFICESDNREPIDECRFSVPGFASEIKIFSGVKKDKYEFVGDGFASGQCGLRLLSVNRNNNGTVKCSIVLVNEKRQEVETEVTVLYPIEKLEIDSNSNGYYEYKENSTMEFRCSAEGGFPPPINLSLLIGTRFLNSNIAAN